MAATKVVNVTCDLLRLEVATTRFTEVSVSVVRERAFPRTVGLVTGKHTYVD